MGGRNRIGLHLVLGLACVAALALAASACGKKQENRTDAGAGTAAATPLPPPGQDLDERKAEGEEDLAGNVPGRPGAGRAPEPAGPLPSEAGAGGASIWISAPNMARTLDRAVALADGLRAAGGQVLGSMPPAAALRAQAEQMLRTAVFGQLLGLPDPSVVDLAQPIRLRLSLPPTGMPLLVASLGTSSPVEPLRSGKTVGMRTPDGRFLVGIGAEPDATAAWPADEAGAADEDVVAAIATGSALPALLRMMQDLQATAGRLGGTDAMPSWMPGLVDSLVQWVVDTMGLDRLVLALRLPVAPTDAPLRMMMGLRTSESSPLRQYLDALGQTTIPFGLLETVDAGAETWFAGRMNPDAIRQLMAAMVAPTEQFVNGVLPEEYRAPTMDFVRATIEAFGTMDGRMVAAMRTLPDGRGSLTIVWGVTGNADASRTALRKAGPQVVTLLKLLSDKFNLGATVTWTEKAARSGNVDVDRLSIAVPRAALGPAADLLQPGTGDLTWNVLFAVSPTEIVCTTDPDATVLQRALTGRARGGGIAAGTPLADRLANPDPATLELGWMDMAAGFRNNPAMKCPPNTSFPPLPLVLDVRAPASGFEVVMDFLPGNAAAIFPFVAAMSACTEAATGSGAPGLPPPTAVAPPSRQP